MNSSAQRALKLSGYRPILERLVDDAAFLWLMRSQAVLQPHYFRDDLMALDQRIQRHLHALLQAPDDSWALVVPSLENADADYCFVAAILAFSKLDGKKIQQVVEVGLSDDRILPGLVSALAWLPGSRIHPWIKKFLISQNLNHKFLGILACSARRDNPKNYLTAIIQRPDCQMHDHLFARALRLAGELKRIDLLPLVREAQQDDREPVRFWASWSAVLLGDTSAISGLRSFALQDGAFQIRALAMILRILDIYAGRTLLEELSRNPVANRIVMQSCAILGDVNAIPWLIQKMHQPESNRLAAEAFVTITGIDLGQEQFLVDPQYTSSIDETQDQFSFDDEYLPFVDARKVGEFWQANHLNWRVGQRYFLGKLTESQHVRDIFFGGNQRQRQMAALFWALLEPTQVLLNHEAMEVMT